MRKLLLLPLLACQSLLAAATLQPESSRQFFLPPDQPATLAFRAPPTLTTARVVIRDIAGREVAHTLATSSAPGRLQVGVKLPQGYHVAVFPELGREFGLVVQPPFTGPTDPFFGIDAALSWLSKPEARRDKLEVMQYCGVTIARERLSWAQVQQGPETLDFQSERRYDDLRKLYAEMGIKMLEVFHNAPAWMPRDAAKTYPTDLVAASENWQKIAGQWKKEWTALDIWNEPDIQFGGNQPADRYTAMAKAIAYATRQAAPETELGAVVLAYLTMPFLDLVARNGLLSSCDFFSFHYYKDPAGLAGHVRDIRGWLERSGQGAMPLWITEMGRSWVKDGNAVRPAPAADIERATIFARDTIESRACGVATIFPFVMVDYAEKGNEMFGLLDINGSPQGAMAAYAQAIRVLHGTEYLGDLKSSPGSRVFQRPGEDQVVIAWLGAQAPGFAPKAIEGMDGRALATPADGLSYVFAGLDQVKADLTTETDAMPLFRMAQASRPKPTAPSPIILFPQVKTEGVTLATRGYQLPDKIESLALDLSVANLGPVEQTVAVSVRSGGVPAHAASVSFWEKIKQWLDGGSPKAASTAPGELSSITLTVPPRTTVNHPLTIALSQLTPDATGTAWLDFVPSDTTIAPSALALLPSLGLGEHLKAYAYQFSVPISDLSRWAENGSGRTTIRKSPEGNWSLKANFSGQGDRWIYPKLKLPQEVQNDRLSAVLLRARFRALDDHSTMRLMTFDRAGKPTPTGFSIIPVDGEWHTVLIPLDSFLQSPAGASIGSQVQEISLGFNTKEDTGELEVSDLYLLGN